MMTLIIEKKYTVSVVLAGSLFLLAGCFSKKDAPTGLQDAPLVSARTSELLLSIDGKPVLYADDFEDQKAMAQQTNQQLNMILQMMPEAEYKMLFKSIAAGHLMKAWVVREGIDQKPELLKQRQQYHEAIDLQLYMKYYEDAHPVHVTEHEAKEYYKQKRDQIPGLLLAPAEVEVLYAQFGTKAEAKDFSSKIKEGSAKHVKAAAKEANIKLEEIKVNAETDIYDTVKTAVLKATKFPSKDIIKIDDASYWVVAMIKKHEAQYRSFDEKQIKDGITKMCQDEKREAQLTQQIEALAKEFNVEENTAYFEKKQQNQAKALQKAEQLVMQAQQHDTTDLDVQEFDVDEALLQDKI